MGSVGRIPVERVVEIREDPPEELAESNWSAKTGYDWVAEDVRTQRLLFRWLRLLKSWLNARRDIIALEQVTVVECACHGRAGSSICICATFHNCTSAYLLTNSLWECCDC